MAWLSGYSKRKELVLTGGASGAQTDFQLSIAVAYAAAMQGDFDDIRFTQSNGTTKIDAWLETKTDDTSATVWVEFPTTPANTVEQDYYMYYGNGSAVSDWDGVATFLHFDDFADGNIATGGTAAWTQISGTTVESAGVMTFNEGLEEVETPFTPVVSVWEIDIKAPLSTNSRGVYFRFMWVDASNYYTLYLSRSSGGTNYMILQKTVAGTPTNIIIANPAHDANSHTYKITRDGSGNFEIFRDNVSQGSTNDAAITTSNKMRLVEIYNVAETIDFDNLMVRKYAANPPTYAFGSEESAPTGHPTMRRWGGTPGMQYTGRRSW